MREQPATMDQNQLQQAALDFLRSVIADESGVGLLYGPKLSGKSDVIERFVRECRDDFAIAVVDGSRLKTSQLLAQIIEQFGYGVQLDTNDELLSMLRVIMVQQTRSYKAPVLVVKNINKMYPSALCVLCNLASQKIHGRFALRIVLVGERYFRRIMNTPSMRPITDRLVGGFELRASQQPRFPKL
ncbi:MAG: hypothetical protein OEM25_05450, partial [Gammaproteobacteria bacterium]|nr:hypothetical protein [Gammaproteobacteria bacterium]